MVARLESFCIAMAIAAQKGMKIWQANFVSAYLNSDCQYDVYIELPPGFAPQGEDNEDGIAPQVERSEREQGDNEEHVLVEGGELGDNEEHILLLLKTVYGMMKGAYDWFYLLDDAFATLEYYQSKADLCVQSRLINGEYTLTSTHTDDIFGVSTTEDGTTEAKAELDCCFEIKDLGTPSIILGMKISQDSVIGLISLTQKVYLERMLECFGMADCNPKSTPLPPGIDISNNLCPKTEEDRLFMIDKPYCSALGGLMWAQVVICPDLSYTVNTLVRFRTKPGPGHWKALMHVYAYVRGTLDYTITYYRGSDETLKPVRYVDANYGGDSGT